mgnify:CR=1 FL=1
MAVLLNLSPNMTDDFGGGVWTIQDSGTWNIVDGRFKQNHAIEAIQQRIKYTVGGSDGAFLDPSTQAYTLCFWIKATSYSSGEYAWAEIHDNAQIGIMLYNNGNSFCWRNDSYSNINIANFEADDTTWHFVALSFPAGSNGTMYLDGVEVVTGISNTHFNQHVRVGSVSSDGNAKLITDDWCYLDYALGDEVPTRYFTDPSIYSAFLSNNSLYTGMSLTNLTNNWSGLTSAEKEALVPSFSDEIPSIQDLATISPFRVLTNDTSSSNVKVTGQPKPQIIEPTSLINTGAVSTIQSINITNTITDATVKFAITTDLSTYKVYDATEGEWIASTNIEEDGMSIAQINALTPEILELLDISNGIAFKQCFIATSENASAELSEISAVVDIDGSWSQSVHGTDYNVSYPNKTTMSVRLLTNGDYIINYPKN